MGLRPLPGWVVSVQMFQFADDTHAPHGTLSMLLASCSHHAKGPIITIITIIIIIIIGIMSATPRVKYLPYIWMHAVVINQYLSLINASHPSCHTART
jgi:type IV secretory pathway VirB2 component (pilin)